MIKSNMGAVEISGTATNIMAEFSSLTKGMVESLTENYGKDEAKEMVERAYKRGLMSENEIKKELRDAILENLESIKNHIEEE